MLSAEMKTREGRNYSNLQILSNVKRNKNANVQLTLSELSAIELCKLHVRQQGQLH